MDDFRPAFGIEWLTVVAQSTDVTERFVTGPPGKASTAALEADSSDEDDPDIRALAGYAASLERFMVTLQTDESTDEPSSDREQDLRTARREVLERETAAARALKAAGVDSELPWLPRREDVGPNSQRLRAPRDRRAV